MLICKNCNTENADGTIKCRQCNMEGNFVQLTTEVANGPVWKVESPAHCKNCGSTEPGGGTHCATCNFPLPQVKKNPVYDSLPYTNRKTG